MQPWRAIDLLPSQFHQGEGEFPCRFLNLCAGSAIIVLRLLSCAARDPSVLSAQV